MGFATESRIAAVWFNLVHITLSTTGILKCLDSTLFSRGASGLNASFNATFQSIRFGLWSTQSTDSLMFNSS